jgi:hypothetical protein
MSETCRALYQIKSRNSASLWLLLLEYITMHGPLNVRSVSCLVTSELNIILGEGEKGNEQLLCVRKEVFPLYAK